MTIFSETTLAGVNPAVSKIEEVIQQLGKPNCVTVRYADQKQEISLGKSYEWQTSNWRLKIATENLMGISQVDVWGARPEGDIAKTGQGLKLGDTVFDVSRVYRLPPYSGLNNDSGHPYPLLSHYGRDTLRIQFDLSGRIYHLTLGIGQGRY
jgi:hypothetical protein